MTQYTLLATLIASLLSVTSCTEMPFVSLADKVTSALCIETDQNICPKEGEIK